MIQFRQATGDDLAILEYWVTKAHVIESDPNDDWNWAVELHRNLHWRQQLIACEDDLPIGFVQIIDPHEEETHYWGAVEPNKRAIDIWIGEEHNLNKGYGKEMMKLAIDICFSNPNVSGILIDPLKTNTKAQRFYERLGFEFVGERNFDDSECFIYELKRSIPSLTQNFT